MVEQWNSDGGTVIVEQWGRKVEQCWLNSETEMVEPWNCDSGKVWCKSGTVWWNSGTVMLEQCRWNNVGGTLRWKSGEWNSMVEQWNSGTVLEEQWNSDSGTV